MSFDPDCFCSKKSTPALNETVLLSNAVFVEASQNMSSSTPEESSPQDSDSPAPLNPPQLSPSFQIAIFDDHLRSMDLVEGTLLVGRSQKNHLTLNDGLLSRKHCSFTRHRGGLTLVDLNSSNGTFVNGYRIGTHDLQKDDIVELGKTVLVIYDGDCWQRGEGLLNLRNPLKAQELIQKLREGEVRRTEARKMGLQCDGVRQQKGLTDREQEFLRYLEQGEVIHLPTLAADYISHKLISLLIRNSKLVRAATTTTLEEMMRPEFFQRFGQTGNLRQAIAELFAEELKDLRSGEAPEPQRDLLDEDQEPQEEDPAEKEIE